MLLLNGNKFAGVPIGHSVILKEHYLTIKMVLENLRDKEHNWVICFNLNMVNILFRQQGDYTIPSCFIRLLDSRDIEQHWQKKN